MSGATAITAGVLAVLGGLAALPFAVVLVVELGVAGQFSPTGRSSEHVGLVVGRNRLRARYDCGRSDPAAGVFVGHQPGHR